MNVRRVAEEEILDAAVSDGRRSDPIEADTMVMMEARRRGLWATPLLEVSPASTPSALRARSDR